MKKFITEATLFLGNHLTGHLINLGHNISRNDSIIDGNIININKLSTETLKKII